MKTTKTTFEQNFNKNMEHFISRRKRVESWQFYTACLSVTKYKIYVNSGIKKVSENICSEDHLRSKNFGPFITKFSASLPVLGFLNI